MATINGKIIFVTTSPRTPSLMIPDIKLLIDHFDGQKWNNANQREFIMKKRERDGIDPDEVALEDGNVELAARDRINRAPKALGFITIDPVIKLTEVGRLLITKKRTEEILLRQLLKFQLPSPYHKQGKNNTTHFFCKPYLEIFRLIRYFGSLSFDEIRIFGLQLVDFNLFDEIVEKIKNFRNQKAKNKGKYKQFFYTTIVAETKSIYHQNFSEQKFKTRETNDKSIQKFIATKVQLSRDYADAMFRYLRATGMVEFSKHGMSISIAPSKIEEVDYFLQTVPREPQFVNNLRDYTAYLTNPNLPVLLTDNKDKLVQKIRKEFPQVSVSESEEISTLKEVLYSEREKKKNEIINEQIAIIKDKQQYDDIVDTFEKIRAKEFYDAPLMFEWNAWRAMTMIDGGKIKANLKFDDSGLPMSTAAGNAADIECDYGDFGLTVELTLSTGQRQFFTEGEPVPRHLGRFKEKINKPVYGLFIANTLNPATIAHFYSLSKLNIDYYGGDTIIVPLELNVFEKMLADSYQAKYVPKPENIRCFFEKAKAISKSVEGENAQDTWHEEVVEAALKWLNN